MDNASERSVMFEIPPIPETFNEGDWINIGVKNAMSQEFSSLFKDEEWIDEWAPLHARQQGWFESPKGLFIVDRPYFTAINRKQLEALAGTQEQFNRIVIPVMYLSRRVMQHIKHKALDTDGETPVTKGRA